MTDPPADPPPAAASLRATARRISRWATNLLVTGIILIAGLVFGRQTIQWWRADAAGGSSAGHVSAVVGPEMIETPGTPLLLEFGDAPLVMRRSECVGSGEQVLAELHALCLAAAREGGILAGPPATAERRLLASTRDLTPVSQTTDNLRVYQLAQPLPMVTVVHGGSQPEDRAKVVAREDRVVSWGLALPGVAEDQGSAWTLFAGAIGDAHAGRSMETLPLPPGGRRTLSIGAEHGGSLVGYVGRGQPSAWTSYYDQWFERQTWTAPQAWQVGSQRWQRRFVREAATADVLIQAEADGSLRAIVMLAER